MCTNDEGPESQIVSVSYYEQSNIGEFYTPYYPPYEEQAVRSRILSKLTHPTTRGTRTMRELSQLKFASDELEAAKELWRAKRS